MNSPPLESDAVTHTRSWEFLSRFVLVIFPAVGKVVGVAEIGPAVGDVPNALLAVAVTW